MADTPTPAPKIKALSRTRYRVYQTGDDGGLTPVRTVEARDPKDAVKQVVEGLDPHTPTRFTVVPERNLTEIAVSVETATKVVFQ